MYRPITLFTGQFADIPIEELAQKASGWGYDGLELACWGDHLDVDQAAVDSKYVENKLELFLDISEIYRTNVKVCTFWDAK